MPERDLGKRTKETRKVNDILELEQILADMGYVDGEGSVHKLEYKKDDGSERESWQMDKLPRQLLDSFTYRTINIQRRAWEDVLKPFMVAGLEDGKSPQYIRGIWQKNISNDWEKLYKLHLEKAGAGGDLLSKQRRTNKVGPPSQRRNLT
ncbi:hypothetical protein A3A76_02325 [Candidatus Woesebacteria bacterium RIFCSPLOWO2_01_FULL_39_23]|uniref:Uncharacterized protein n=1 Tax=Candidatus Woesebacteria bacterium RIFCSPHIGHO2_01_FULL_40_22 TaxID=1802499 RepID=A0A1F7YJ53_9BACT|nr:MAG: hypothetical protein A2628_00730 [Candidatus Woesebacteria bacterium RIFCSPHIGHO2_01_FULL_40_22]OGM62485.1 MAG: hypothetical protein A3A76_02325 [Candidatus Woesebacteria bacterium RIFCSPLOWO2_01_FULL_39_23]